MQSRAEEVGVASTLYVALFTEEHMTEHTAQEKQQVWWLISRLVSREMGTALLPPLTDQVLVPFKCPSLTHFLIQFH